MRVFLIYPSKEYPLPLLEEIYLLIDGMNNLMKKGVPTMTQDYTPREITKDRLSAEERKLTDRPFTKAEAQARWTPEFIARVEAAMVVYGD